MDLSSKERDSDPDRAGLWGGGKELILELDEGALKLIQPETGETLNSQVNCVQSADRFSKV